ncbi:DMT family transporter [Streptococcus equinus]|uniref:DMT family transporter n=1 Tax=Streptococcus equinus TaxID=1335 RepID=UPI003BF82332
MKKFITNGYLFILIAGILWGLIGPFVKQMENCGASAIETSFLRVFFAFFIMFVLCIFQSGWSSFRIDFKTLLSCILLGLVCHGIYNIFYSLAVRIIGVSISAVLLNIAPVFTLFAAFFCFHESLTRRKLFAILVNILGCILTVTNGHLTASGISLLGVFFGVLAGLCYAMTAIIGKITSNKTNPFAMSMYSYLAASFLLFVWMRPWTHRTFSASKELLTWGFLYALIPTALAYLLYYIGLENITETSKVPVIASVETIAATILGIIIYHESLGNISIFGILLVLLSIIILNTKQKNTT